MRGGADAALMLCNIQLGPDRVALHTRAEPLAPAMAQRTARPHAGCALYSEAPGFQPCRTARGERHHVMDLEEAPFQASALRPAERPLPSVARPDLPLHCLR